MMRRFSTKRTVVLVDACRTPFQVSGTGFKDVMGWQLARTAMSGLATRNPALKANVDKIVFGNVIQEVKTTNIGREAALAAGFDRRIPANTVTMACISSNKAMADVASSILAGDSKIGVAGGVETMSDVPIRFSRPIRQRMLASTRVKGTLGKLGLLKGLGLKDLAPETPPIAEFSTQEVMGHSADRLAAVWGVSRQDQDAYALRSHQNAAMATKEGFLTDRLALSSPVVCSEDNGIKGDSTIEKLSGLRPAFIRPHGTVTAASSSFLTDGASAAIIADEAAALDLGMKPKAYLRDFVFTGMDPAEELLLGPAYSIVALLKRNNLTIKDIGVWEIHEAFAGQVLANLNAMESAKFCEQAGGSLVGRLPMDKINTWGGSLSLGHPFAATGVRLAYTAASRLVKEDQQYAVVAACAAGGLGHACLVQRY